MQMCQTPPKSDVHIYPHQLILYYQKASEVA